MGHSRLGSLPRTRKWQEVVGLIAIGAAADQIANAVIRAAERGLMAVAHHQGLVEAFWSLTQLTAAARDGDFAASLAKRGFDAGDAPSLPALLAAVSDRIDAAMPSGQGRTDLGEIAQSAAVETIAQVVTDRNRTLFSSTPADIRQTFHELGTQKNFGGLARRFFGHLTGKVLEAYISREAANHVGPGQRFANLADKAQFDGALRLHCHEASRIVERFAGEWLSKQTWQTGPAGITQQSASGFAHVAMKKMVQELQEGAQ